MDFLGLKNLTMIDKTIDLVAQSTGVTVDPDKLPLDDAGTYGLLARGDLEGIFQLESSGMRQIVRDLKPSSLEDISSILALYRPGPLDAGLIPKFINRKHGREAIDFVDAKLEPILQEEPERLESALQPGQLRGNVALSNVRFGYPGSADEVLKGVSIEIPAGASVAIVGASGSGKSTIVRLLLGLERPSSGRVLVDGQDLARLDPVAVRRQMGVVMQKGQIIPGTVAENILGSTVLTLDDAWDAAEQAGLAEDIEAMPMGMHTYVNPSTLSGGQQQKVLLARALLGQPRVVVLDEATSALDEQSQATVVESMERLEVTRIAVAHRVSTIRTCDRIYVIERGLVAQQGTFDELLAAPGTFRRLVERQLTDLEPVDGGESSGEDDRDEADDDAAD
jgi:ABC-type multidrug transport system fused ATPase/permease subunit